ncbi:MAG: Coenzyme F420 hydrogenase/dehydrogenase, beta subunit C-terminal domain [Phenylobacterium sp.]|uniref:Coenzyme F420 hydrogenase/dehydrogenase, beta subunit C-terminal domain n=1 Tax=Phenylobacterium sp. TaxID=1871053 RepID=UPI00391C2547
MPPSPDRPTVSPQAIDRAGLCIGCGVCAALSGAPDAAMVMSGDGRLRPGEGAWRRRPSQAVARACPFSPAAEDETSIAAREFPAAPVVDPTIGRMEAAYVGHVREGAWRERGSSGGLATWVAAELLDRGLVDAVAHVAPTMDGRFFRYRISRTREAVQGGARSRYYPVDLSEVLAEIRDRPGRYAVVGVPCFIKAVQLARRHDPLLRRRVAFTLGLFCGHMKSARFVESFAWQMGAPSPQVERVEFRCKAPDRPANWYVAELGMRGGGVRRRDWWSLADGDWGAGFFQLSACNACDDVIAETADISFGDAWVEPYASDAGGTNVVVARSSLMRELMEAGKAAGRLQLEPVDADFVVRTQAAGFRQRREGLAYRLTWPGGPRLRKRVAPGRPPMLRRRLIYRARALISAWSHPVFRTARAARSPWLYLGWARAAAGAYHGLAYSRGRFGRLLDRILPAQPPG